jgi:hypothetical protein
MQFCLRNSTVDIDIHGSGEIVIAFVFVNRWLLTKNITLSLKIRDEVIFTKSIKLSMFQKESEGPFSIFVDSDGGDGDTSVILKKNQQRMREEIFKSDTEYTTKQIISAKRDHIEKLQRDRINDIISNLIVIIN